MGELLLENTCLPSVLTSVIGDYCKINFDRCIELKGHTDRVRSLAVLPDGRIVSGASDKTLRVWG